MSSGKALRSSCLLEMDGDKWMDFHTWNETQRNLRAPWARYTNTNQRKKRGLTYARHPEHGPDCADTTEEDRRVEL
ncbi:hypothetical protein JZ751_026004, partial [Albula glossodonta]